LSLVGTEWGFNMLISFTTEDKKVYKLIMPKDCDLGEILICIEQQYPFFDYGLIEHQRLRGYEIYPYNFYKHDEDGF